MKKIFIILVIFFAHAPLAQAASTKSSASPSTSASTKSTSITDAEIKQSLSSYTYASSSNKLAKLKIYADNLIQQRIENLNLFLASDFSDLNSSQKQKLQILAQTDVTNLTTLQNSINNSTDLSAAKQSILSIFSNYNIYKIRLPQLYLAQILYQSQNTLMALQDLNSRLQITKADDQTNFSNILTDYQTQVSDAKTHLDAAQKSYDKIDPKSSSSALVTSASDNIKLFRADVVAALGDVKAIQNLISGDKILSSPSASVK